MNVTLPALKNQFPRYNYKYLDKYNYGRETNRKENEMKVELCEKLSILEFQEEVFHARGEVLLLQGTLITDLIISFMYEQRPFRSRIRVNKPNFRLNPLNGGATYLLTGR